MSRSLGKLQKQRSKEKGYDKKIPMQGLVVIQSGIMGSVLQKDGQDIWAVLVK